MEAPATTVLLLASVAGLWARRDFGLALFAGAVLAGLAEGVLLPLGALALGAFALGAWFHGTGRGGWPLWVALSFGAAALSLHVVPGFEGWIALGPVSIGAGAPYEKWLSLDKTGVGVLLVGLALPAIWGRRDWPGMLRGAAPFLILTPLILAVLGLASGAIRWDFTPVPVFFQWAALNLLTTCVAEEALFRGLLQTRLVVAATARGLSPHPAILVASLVFGLAHFPGGPGLVALATAAGLCYGYAYHRTGRLEAAILAHFALNAAHFLLFTYPFPADALAAPDVSLPVPLAPG